MQIFVLSHAKVFLRSSDSDGLLQFRHATGTEENFRELSYGEWWPIAAASVRPARLTEILDSGGLSQRAGESKAQLRPPAFFAGFISPDGRHTDMGRRKHWHWRWSTHAQIARTSR
jgi:hypothetical protein